VEGERQEERAGLGRDARGSVAEIESAGRNGGGRIGHRQPSVGSARRADDLGVLSRKSRLDPAERILLSVARGGEDRSDVDPGRQDNAHEGGKQETVEEAHDPHPRRSMVGRSSALRFAPPAPGMS
jgi:hypothetical protein